MEDEPQPKHRFETVREALREELRYRTATARELSGLLDVHEPEIAEHLAHLERSLAHHGERLVMEPAECLACGFLFQERTRYGRPGRCPQCRKTRIRPPAFHIESAGA